MTESELSAEGDAQTPLPAPTDLEVVDVRGDEADVRFEDHADNKRGYRAYVGEDGYLSFDGEDQYTTMGQTQSLRTAGDSALYAEISGLTEGSHQYIFGNEWNWEGGAIVIDNGNVLYRFSDGGSATDVVSSVDVTDGERHTIWGWYDSASETGYISVDGETPNEATGVRVEQSTSIDFVVAAGRSGKQMYLNANVHRAGAFSRIPDKREREITRQGAKPTGGMGWYEFNQGSGDTLTDYSGNGNHGTLQNGPTWVGGGDLTQNGGDLTPNEDSFETLRGWDVTHGEQVSDRVYDGSFSFFSGVNDTDEQARYTVAEGGEQLSEVTYYWQETSGSYGGGIRLKNSNGDYELGVATDKPEWDIDSASGIDQRAHQGNFDQNYSKWVRFTVTFDWDAGTFTFTGEDLDNGFTESKTYDLKEGVDIKTVELWNYNRGIWGLGNLNMWWDAFEFYDANGDRLRPVHYTLTGLENGEAYVTRASVFTDHEEVFDS